MKLLTQWAVTSSALIMIVLAARFLLKDKLSARLKYALWGVVLLRLLVPLQVELPANTSTALPVLASNFAPEVADMELYALRTASRPMSEDNLAEMRERGVAPGTVIGTEAPIHQIGDVEIEGYAHCFVLSDTGIDTYFFYTTLPKFLMTLWVIGALWVALTIFRSNRYFFGRLKYYRHEPEGVEAPIPVYTAANLSSPCLFGVLRPAVYLIPQATENPDALRHILAHELTHYKHRDHIWSLLRCLALALHWYNPLVWLAVVLSKQDGELACDEGAVARLGEAERIAYGRTLVDMVAARSLRPADLLSCSTAMTGGGKSVKQRVAALVKKPETVKAALFAAVAVVALAAVFVFGTRPAAQPAEGDPLERFRTEVEHAVSVRYIPPIYSSQLYPNPITDPALLTLTKEQLSLFVLQDPDTVVTGWAQKLMNASRITLSDGERESTYALLLGVDGRTYLFSGADADAYLSLEEGETPVVTPIARTENRHSIEGTIASYARTQSAYALDPSYPIPMTNEALNSYTPEGIWEACGYRLQGWDGDLKNAKFHIGYTTQDRIQLWYHGDETHAGDWVLELTMPSLDSNHAPAGSGGYTILSDRPMEVFNAARYAGDPFSYEPLGPGAFIAFLRPEDVIGAYRSQDGAPIYGEQIAIGVEEIKELAVQGLYHQRLTEYDWEKHNQYALTIAVKQDLETTRDYKLADTANRLTLSIGQEPDVVCLSHQTLRASSGPLRQFIYSPELYRAIQTIHGLVPGQAPLPSAFSRYHSRLSAAQGIWRSSTMLHNGRVVTDSAQLEQLKELLALEPLTAEESARTWDGVWSAAISFTSAVPDPDWTGGDPFFYVSYGSGGWCYLILPTSQDERSWEDVYGIYLGKLPAENWDAANELFKNAPSVDDRQHAARNTMRDVLLGQAQFQFVSQEGRVSFMDVHSVPSIFSPSSSYAALSEFAVVDLDGDGIQEVVVHTADVGNDLTGYLVLRQKDSQVYGYPSNWRTFWNLKTDGTFDYSLWNGSEDGTARLYFSDGDGPYFGCTLLATGPGNGADFDTFLVNGNNTTEEEYRRAVREQQTKPDAVWYDFTEVNIRTMLP